MASPVNRTVIISGDSASTIETVTARSELGSTAAGTPDTSPPTSRSRSPDEPKASTSTDASTVPLEPMEVKNICFVGAGFVGGPTAALIAFHNPHIQVTVVDLNAERVAAWNSPHLPIHETGLPKIVRIARDGTNETTAFLPTINKTIKVAPRTPNLTFSTDLENGIGAADIVLICVNTPTKTYGIGAGMTADLSAVEGASETVAKYAKNGAVVVEKSTVPTGTARMIREILAQYRPRCEFEVVSNPEFLAEGTAVRDLMNPDRILIGSNTTPAGLRAAAALKGVYAGWVPESKILTVNTWSSELTKLVANAMLAQRISSINSISAMCEELGADVQEISRGIGADSRLGKKFLHAGVGFGGSCFEKDILNLSYMARVLHLDTVADYWMGVLDINKYQRQRFAEKVHRALNGNLRGKKVAIFGFAFKEGTNDTRNSIAVHIIRQLANERPREIAIFDPGCSPEEILSEVGQHIQDEPTLAQVKVRTNWRETTDGASAICILTPWYHFHYPKQAQATARRTSLWNGSKEQQLADANTGFLGPHPTEMDLIELENCVTRGKNKVPLDPLKRLKPEACPENCKGCNTSSTNAEGGGDPVDWEEVSAMMKLPKLVLDGRNVVSAPELEKLGFKVQGIGKGVGM
ncbi:UDP-glucose 6-dehydrogenase [Sodiomyces alkalinus F11]|uniref:UDP-glucose 6-dehydrogenase n=1 Tax=Sodiomyces alkalinus (strain CBS 110278 / VKM F-3762 / F11) TaxID=1314773 RepID=A0A3N2PU41_SODAK|nr:UDP-glucose 6-dehydrogenase [Sodiomyces alkalinus F11]ROT38002.1 UDP-glucose 6-dehydrogenase [Sodiomyces alkalinus F11]